MSICTISGTILMLDGSPAAEQQILFSVRSTKDDQGGQIASYTNDLNVTSNVGVASAIIAVFTDSEGYFEVDLVRGVHAIMEVPGINLCKEIAVPDAATADFVSLI